MFSPTLPPPNFTLGPPPKPPWVQYQLSCTNGGVLLHVDFGGMSTPRSDDAENSQSDSSTVSILGILIGVMALILTCLVVFLYIYKKKVIKDEVQHHDKYINNCLNKPANTLDDLKKKPCSDNTLNLKKPPTRPVQEVQPYCNVFISKPDEEFIKAEHDSHCYATIEKDSTTTSGVSSVSCDANHIPQSQENKVFNRAPTPIYNPEIILPLPKQNIVMYDEKGRDIKERFFTLQAPKHSTGESRNRRRRRRLSQQRPRDDTRIPSRPAFTPTYGTMDGYSIPNYNPFGQFETDADGRLPYTTRESLLRMDGNQDFNSLSDFKLEAPVVAPYRQSRRAPYMGIRSIRSSSLSSCAWDPDD